MPNLPTDLSNNTTRQRSSPSSNRPVNSISKGWGCERSAEFSGSIIRRSLAGWSKLPSHSQQAHHRPKPAPSSKAMNSARSSLKKSQCWLWLAVDSSFGKVLGFACGRRTIKTGKVPWQQIKHLLTMGYGMDMLKAYENFCLLYTSPSPRDLVLSRMPSSA